jgi:uncharacterized integral membrane protein
VKIVRLLLLLAVLVGGLVIGSLNSQPIDISLAFWVLQTTSGVAIIASLLLGALVGGAAGACDPAVRQIAPRQPRQQGLVFCCGRAGKLGAASFSI